MRRSGSFCAAMLVLLTVGGELAGQAPDASNFDVASVKLHPSGVASAAQPGLFLPGGRFTAVNMPLSYVIASAYGVSDDRLLGGPGWLKMDRFDISAKGDERALRPQLTIMLRALLAERLKLMVHTESRETPVYWLLVARSDGRLGSELRPTSPECSEMLAARARGETSQLVPPPAAAGPPARGDRAPCGMIRTALNFLTATGTLLPDLASMLSGLPRRAIGRIVQDHTGLAGRYDVDLHWSLDRLGNPSVDAAGTAAPSDGEPEIFTALLEQLGLKLQSVKVPIDVVVIDHVERPTEN